MSSTDARVSSFAVPASSALGTSTGTSVPQHLGESSTSAETSAARASGPTGSHATTEAEHSAADSSDYRVYPQLLNLLQEWRAGNLPLSEVFLRGSNFIQLHTGISSSDKPSLLTHFLNAADKGKAPAVPSGQDESDVLRRIQSTLDREAGDGGHADGDDDSDFGETRKRHRGLEPDGSEPQGKSQKIREEDFPWFASSRKFAEEKLTADMRETRRIIVAARPDVSTASFWAQQAPGAPSGFPVAEWSNIFHGRAVDLDNVHANLYLPQLARENVERVGGVAIVVSTVDKSKGIKTSSDWAAAWRRTIKATTIVFPHRLDELEEYSQYIESLFRATVTAQHERIFLLDRAIRGHVGGGQSSSLLDEYRHRDIHTAIMHAGGVEFRSGKPTNVDRTNEVCNRFNSRNGCKGPPNCRYKHLCKQCGESGHGRTTCTKGTPVPKVEA